MVQRRVRAISPRSLEIASVLILSVTTVVTAWTAFQSAKWGGVQADSYAAAGAARTESVRFSSQASEQTGVDVLTFVTWAEAMAREDELVADFLFERFRDEFKPAVDAWLATTPLQNPDAPSSPFAMEEYVVDNNVKAARLAAEADEFAAEAREANQRSDNYVATTILFAGVLFFAGMATKFETPVARLSMTAFAAAGLLAGLTLLVTFPVEF